MRREARGNALRRRDGVQDALPGMRSRLATSGWRAYTICSAVSWYLMEPVAGLL